MEAVLTILFTSPLPVALVILGVICIVLAIIGQIPPMYIQGIRAVSLAVFGGVLIAMAIFSAWLLVPKSTSSAAESTPIPEISSEATVETGKPSPTTSRPTQLSKLDEILARGTLIVAPSPSFHPQSQLIENATRTANTKCTSAQYTVSEFSGFDIDIAREIAERLGVEACFMWDTWDVVTDGNWNDRWDISIGSMTITSERMRELYFTQPYYTVSAVFFVHSNNTAYSQASDLSRKKIGVCSACTYEDYLNQSLNIPGETVNFVVEDATIVTYNTSNEALQDLSVGDGENLDAVLTDALIGQVAIANGLSIKQLGNPVYLEYLAAAIDKNSELDPVPFVKKVNEIVQEMHQDGTLKRIFQQYYGAVDFTTAAGNFNIDTLGQFE